MMSDLIHKTVQISDFKVKNDKERSFTCYGNVKNVIDHAGDRAVDGCYTESINRHKRNDTRPKMFWNHNWMTPPVGSWKNFEEDRIGLFYDGKIFTGTERSNEIWTGMIEGEINSFSIGYRVIQEKWNIDENCNDLIELDIFETSPVNFACNEASTLQSIQKSLHDGELLSKSDLRKILQFAGVGLSKRQIENITSRYSVEPQSKSDINELCTMLENSQLCQ